MRAAALFFTLCLSTSPLLRAGDCDEPLFPGSAPSPFLEAYKSGDLDLVYENSDWLVALDIYPSRPGHMLIIPKRHFQSYFEMTPNEWLSLDQVIKEVPDILRGVDLEAAYTKRLAKSASVASKSFLTAALKSPFLGQHAEDFTIAINEGKHAGRSVEHLHIHVVPRFEGDVEDPLGGFRAMFPGDGNYLKIDQNISALEAANNYYNTENSALQYFRFIREVRGVMKELKEMEGGLRRRKNVRWLDIGFGPGIEFEALIKKGYSVDGVDISGPMTIQLQKILDKKGHGWRQRGRLFTSSLQDFELRERHYDRIWSMATFLHLDRDEIAPMINKYGRGLKKNGKFFLNFKVGSEDKLILDSQGRPFSNFTKESFIEEILPEVEGLTPGRIWIPEDDDKLGRSTQWLQIVFHRSR